MLTLIVIVCLLFLVGTEYTLIIAATGTLIYLYPIQATLLLCVLGYLKWQGLFIKQKLVNHWNKRKPK
jgi:hypothetical protein